METISRRILETYDQLERDSLDLHTLFEFAGGNPPGEREAVLDAVSDLVKKGFLSAGEGGDFYKRSEDGRLAVVGPRDITLYTREGCHLCEEARVQITPMLAAFGATLREVDVDDDPVLHERYTNDVPVIFLAAQMVAQHRLAPAQLRRLLESAKKQSAAG